MPPETRVPAIWSAARPAGRAARVLLAAAAVGAAVALHLPLCPFAFVTRQPCPGCGLTRATLALAQGHITEAFHLHPLAILVSPTVLVAFGYNIFTYITEGRRFAAEAVQGRWITRFGVALGAVLVAVWIARFFGAFGGPVPV